MFNGKKKKELEKELGTLAVGGAVYGDYDAEINQFNSVKKISDYRAMLNDSTVQGLFNILTMPLLASEYEILPEDETPEAAMQADFVRRNLFEASYKGGIETPFELFLDEAMLALIDGFAVWEKVYRITDSNKIELKKLAIRDSRSLELVSENGEYVGVKQLLENGKVIEIPAYKTLLFTHNKKFNKLYGRSVLAPLWRNYDKKWKLEYLDNIALQNDAIKPKVLTRTDSMASLEGGVMSRIQRALGRLGNVNSGISLPFGFDLKTLDSNGRDPHQSIERQKSEMAFAFMANFMMLGAQGSSSSGSWALSDTQSGVFQIGLQSILDKLEAHINQYLIADLVELNFAKPHYPIFKFAKIDRTATQAIFESFKILLQKDKVSEDVIKEIEADVAVKLGLNVEQSLSEKPEKTCEIHLSEEKASNDKHFKNLEKKWRELEDRFLVSSRQIVEDLAAKIHSGGEITLPAEYRALLVAIFKQAYTEGKIFSANREGRKAGKNRSAFSNSSREYVDWIVEKQEADLREFWAGLDLGLVDDPLEEVVEALVASKLAEFFEKRLKPTATYLVGRGVNAGIYSDFEDDDLIEYSSVMDGQTTAGCAHLNGKVMKWSEWRASPELIPPRHFGCRATLVRIVEGGGVAENKPDVSRLNTLEAVEHTPKKELIKNNPVLKSYTKKEIDAMVYYKGSGYNDINNYLRNPHDQGNDYIKESVEHLEKAIARNKFTEDTVIYRGFGLDYELRVGESFSELGFMSTSMKKGISADFTNTSDAKYKYLFKIEDIKGSPMLEIDNVLKSVVGETPFEESEILLNRGKSVIIDSIIKKGDIYMANVKFTDETKNLTENQSVRIDDGFDDLRRAIDESKERLKNMTPEQRENIRRRANAKAPIIEYIVRDGKKIYLPKNN